MMKTTLRSLMALALVAGMVCIGGCSGDDDSSNNNNTTTPSIYLDIKANSTFIYDRTSLDTLGNPIASSTHDYAIAFKSSGGLYQGAYKDWFYRIGTDVSTLVKDTLYIRTNTGSASGKSFTKEVQVYGMITSIHQRIANLILTAFPLATPPAIAGADWDIVAMYMDQDGKAFDVGKEWTLGSVNGTDLNFNILGTVVPVNVKIKGKLDARDEIVKVGTTDVKTWKTSLNITLSILSGLSTSTLKISTWFSENPDGQVKVVQESTSITIPIVNQKIQIPGEMQVLKSWTE